MRPRKILMMLIALSLLSGRAWATPAFYIENSTESEVRGRQSGGREAPLNNFTQFSLSELPRSLKFTGYGQFTHTFGQSNTSGYNLYNFEVSADKFTDIVGISAGRMTEVRGNFEGIVDGASLRLTPGNFGLAIDLYGGFTRQVELSNYGDFNATPGLLGGLQGAWRPNSDTSVTLGTSYLRYDYKTSGWNRNSTQLINLSASQRFGPTRTFQLFLNGTYDVAGKVVPVGTLGAMWQVTPLLTFTTSGNIYGANRQLVQPSILSLLIGNKNMWQGRFGARYSVIDELSLFANYDFQYLKAGTATKYGSVMEAGVDCNVRRINLTCMLMYQFLDSYGGQSNSVLLTIRQSPIKQIVIDQFTNYSKYKKVTGNNGYAVAVGLGASYTPVKYVALRIGGEFDRNNIFSRDWRIDGSLKIRWDNM